MKDKIRLMRLTNRAYAIWKLANSKGNKAVADLAWNVYYDTNKKLQGQF